jgi:hypothetical protein
MISVPVPGGFFFDSELSGYTLCCFDRVAEAVGVVSKEIFE